MKYTFVANFLLFQKHRGNFNCATTDTSNVALMWSIPHIGTGKGIMLSYVLILKALSCS